MTQKIKRTQEEWIVQAAICELIAMSLALPTKELAEILVAGEFAEALVEVGEKTGFDSMTSKQLRDLLAEYKGQDAEELFHILRTEYTRLFVGAPKPAVSPYAGVWHAREQGVEPLLFVSPRAMEIERFMRSYGIGQAEGKNEPLDNISTEFEFLQFLALVNAGAVEVPECIDIPESAFGTFFSQYVANWADGFAAEVQNATKLAFYQTVAEVIKALL